MLATRIMAAILTSFVVGGESFVNHGVNRQNELFRRPVRHGRHDHFALHGKTRPSITTLSLNSPMVGLGIGFGIDKTVAMASLAATAKLLSSIGIGGWAASRPHLLDSSAVSALSRLTYWIFQPAFLFCSVATTMAATLTGSSGLPLAVMPLAAATQILLGTIMAKIITKVGNFQEDENRNVAISLTFANSGPLPLIFADALFASSPAIKSDVAACISFYLVIWSPLFWTVGRMLLGTYNKEGNEQPKTVINRVGKEAQKVLSPPVVACLVGIIVGAIPILRFTFLHGLGTPIFGAFKTLGTAYIPAALLVLAGSLFGRSEETDAPETSVPTKKAMGYLIFSRFVLSPICGILLVRLLGALNMLGSGRSRAVVTFVILMESCMPPAQNSVILLQLEGMQKRAKFMASMLTLIYTMAVIPVTVLLSGCLEFSRILSFT